MATTMLAETPKRRAIPTWPDRLSTRLLLALTCTGALAACEGKGAGAAPYLHYAGRALCVFTQEQVEQGGSARPAAAVTASPFSEFVDVAVDERGAAWAIGLGTDQILRFPPSALLASGPAAPDLVISSSALREPGSLAFDRGGNLWVANRKGAPAASGNGTIVRFDRPGALSGTRDLSPALRLASDAGGALLLPGAIAFDASGNLWVTSYAGIVRFDAPGALAGDVVLAPGATLLKSGYAGNVYFYGIAFDASGALWASAAIGVSLNSVVKFDGPGQLSGSSSPAPAVTIDGGSERLPAGGLAFDARGDLWVASADAVVAYANPGSLSGNVSPAPAITLGVVNEATPALNAHLVFHPAPPGLPVSTGD